MMKSVVFLLAFFCIDNISAQVKISVKAGPTYTTALVKDSSVKRTTDYKPGFAIAFQLEMPFDGVLHFAPFISYNTRSFKTTYPTKKLQTTIGYIDIAPNLSIELPASHSSNFAIAFGPVFGVSSFGNEKTTQNGNTTSQKIHFGYGTYGMFDLGLNGSIGYHGKKVFAEISYLLGLVNINNNESLGDINIQQRMLGLNLGYYIK